MIDINNTRTRAQDLIERNARIASRAEKLNGQEYSSF